jgi:hypothetical protein
MILPVKFYIYVLTSGALGQQNENIDKNESFHMSIYLKSGYFFFEAWSDNRGLLMLFLTSHGGSTIFGVCLISWQNKKSLSFDRSNTHPTYTLSLSKMKFGMP